MKRLKIKVIPNSKQNVITQENELIKVKVTAPAVDDKANKAVIEVLSKHFEIRKSSISIIKGAKSSHKTIQVVT